MYFVFIDWVFGGLILMNKGMKKHVMRAAACFVTGSMLAGSSSMAAFAAGTNLVGVSTTVNVKEAAAEDTQKTEETESTTEGTASEENTESAEAAQDSSLIGTVAVAQPGDETFFNIRANADANSDVVGYLYENNCATILGEEGDWYYIQSGNCTGYVAKYLMTTGADAAAVVEQAATPVAQVNAEALMVRSEPSEDADVVDTVTADQIVYLEEDLGGWAKISTGSTEGYVSADYVKISTSGDNSAGNNNSAGGNNNASVSDAYNIVLAELKSHIGSPYAYGGSGELVTNASIQSLKNRFPDYAAAGKYDTLYKFVDTGVRMFDCSGFMQWGFKKANINIGRTTYDQIKSGVEVSLDSVQPGDLLFYSDLGHVGMYIGDGQWIESPNSGKTVRIVNVPWNLIGRARRVL